MFNFIEPICCYGIVLMCHNLSLYATVLRIEISYRHTELIGAIEVGPRFGGKLKPQNNMFKPYKGICTGKPGKIEGCQNQGIIMTNSRKLCQSCEAKRKKRPQMVKVSDKKKLAIKASENYYRIAIAAHIAQNKGKCPCEECGINIENPTGMNVSHILPGSGRTKSLYLHPDNHKILCKVGDNKDNWGHSCHNVWEVGARDAMKIYEDCMQVKEQLLATLIADI